MSKGERADDWLPDSMRSRRRAAPRPQRAEPEETGHWTADERRERARRLSDELSEWVSELRARSEALDSRLKDVEAAR